MTSSDELRSGLSNTWFNILFIPIFFSCMGSQQRNLEAGCNILSGTMGRLLALIEMGKVLLDQVQYFVMDEADRMLDKGFNPNIEKLINSTGMPPKTERSTLMFSATLSPAVFKFSKIHQKEDLISITMGVSGTICVDVQQEFIKIDKKEWECSRLS